MPTPSNAIEELDRLLVEDPCGEDIASSLAVAGDLLLAQGDPRGEWIALERALAAADKTLARTLRTTLRTRLAEHSPALRGLLQLLRHQQGFDFLGGRVVNLDLDLRSTRSTKLGGALERTDRALASMLASPLTRQVRVLQVRVRNESEVPPVLERISSTGSGLPLEVLLVSPTTRPLGHQIHAHAIDLRKHLPRLWLVTRFARITPMIDPDLPDREVAEALLEARGEPMSAEMRVRIGRGLSSGRKHTTLAACELLTQLGPSGRVFAPTLDLLLRPQVSHAALWILTHMRRFGPWARVLLPRLRRIPGDARNYPANVRLLAGRCQRAFEAPV